MPPLGFHIPKNAPGMVQSCAARELLAPLDGPFEDREVWVGLSVGSPGRGTAKCLGQVLEEEEREPQATSSTPGLCSQARGWQEPLQGHVQASGDERLLEMAPATSGCLLQWD